MKSVIRLIRDIVFLGFDWGAVFILIQKTIRSDLLVIRLDAIGDFIIWLDSAKELRRCYPEKKITLLANESWAGLAKHFDYWDEVIPVSLKVFVNKPVYRWRVLWKMRMAGYDVVIQTQFSRVFLAGDSIVRASGARERIGSVGDVANMKRYQKRLSDRWYTRLLPASAESLMEIERNAEFIRKLTGKPFAPSISEIPPLCDLPLNIRPERPYFIIFPGASAKYKQWPAEKFADVMNLITQKYAFVPVLCGAPSEKALCAEVASRSDVFCMDYSGKTSLPEFIEVIRNATLLIGNDTSAVHIAAAVGTPSICILGGGHFGRFVPYPESVEGEKPVAVYEKMQCFGCNWRCTQPHIKNETVPCIENILVDTVLLEVDKLLAKKQRREKRHEVVS